MTRPASVVGLLGLLLLVGACSSGPSLPEPAGELYEVRLISDQRLMVGDREMDPETLVAELRERVLAAGRSEGQAPRVRILLSPFESPGFLDRFIRDLQKAGVRAVDIEG